MDSPAGWVPVAAVAIEGLSLFLGVAWHVRAEQRKSVKERIETHKEHEKAWQSAIAQAKADVLKELGKDIGQLAEHVVQLEEDVEKNYQRIDVANEAGKYMSERFRDLKDAVAALASKIS